MKAIVAIKDDNKINLNFFLFSNLFLVIFSNKYEMPIIIRKNKNILYRNIIINFFLLFVIMIPMLKFGLVYGT